MNANTYALANCNRKGRYPQFIIAVHVCLYNNNTQLIVTLYSYSRIIRDAIYKIYCPKDVRKVIVHIGRTTI